MKTLVFLFVLAFCVSAQTITTIAGTDTVGNSRAVINTNFSNTAARIAQLFHANSPGTSLPATCTAGVLFFKTDATAGQNLYMCSATDTWTQQLNSGGGSSGIDAVYTSYNIAYSSPAAISMQTANVIRAVQVVIPATTVVNSIGGMKSTAVSGETARLAVYDANCNLMLQSAEISLTATGHATTTLGAPVTLSAGKYYFAWASSTATSSLGGTAVSSTAAPPWTGNGTNKLAVSASVSSTIPGAGMPASCGTWSAIGTSGFGVPIIWIAP